MIASRPPSASLAAAASDAASLGTANLPDGGGWFVARRCAFEHASTNSKPAAAPIDDSRNRRRLSPAARARPAARTWARRIASRAAGAGGPGTNSPFEHGPSLIGGPGSTSSRRAIHEAYVRGWAHGDHQRARVHADQPPGRAAHVPPGRLTAALAGHRRGGRRRPGRHLEPGDRSEDKEFAARPARRAVRAERQVLRRVA